MTTKLFAATKTFVINKRKVLILRESTQYQDGTNVGRYDVPGGRVKPGQRFDKSLLREIKEEAGLDVKIGKPFFVDEWRHTVRGERWQIVGIYFKCSSNSRKVTLSNEHDDYQWIDPKNYRNYPLIGRVNLAFEAWLGEDSTQ